MKRYARAAAFVGLLCSVFVWGYQAHRARWFPFPVVSWFLVDTESLPYSWVRPTSRPAAALRDLSYVSSTFDPDSSRRDVLVHEAAAHPGVNLYYSGFDGPFYLIDMDGNELHRWTDPEAEGYVAHAELLPGGDLIVVRFDRHVVRLDAQSRVIWTTAVRAHHGVVVVGDELWLLSRRAVARPQIHPTLDTLEDTVTILALADGSLIREFSLLDAVAGSPYAFLIPGIAGREFRAEDGPLDITHSNHIEVFDGSLADRSPLFSRGNQLVSFRHLNAIMILEAESHDVLWVWGPSNTYGQHHPRLLGNGNILLFDNGVVSSRVLELDPLQGRVVWSYGDERLYSALRGSVQRLANGNTLVTESDTGYVLEVTYDGEIVWEFANPDVDIAGQRGVIWRMTRHDPASDPFLANLAAAAVGQR